MNITTNLAAVQLNPGQAAFRAALLVVDVQTGLDDPQYGERCNPDCEANIHSLQTAWRAAQQPILYTRHISLRPGSPLARSSDRTSIKQEVAPMEDEPVFEKSVNSAFKIPELLQAVRSLNPAWIVVVGLATDACVTATAREAKDLGFQTIVVGDACATFPRSIRARFYPAAVVQDVSLGALAASGIKICTPGEAINLMAGCHLTLQA